MQNSSLPSSDNLSQRGFNPDEEAVLFNAGVRALGNYGYSNFKFDIGGKKSRRRYLAATAPTGELCMIWIKIAIHWVNLANVIRFPWSKKAVNGDDLTAILFAADDAMRRGATHLLSLVGDPNTAILSFARIYSVEEIKKLAKLQVAACNHPFYMAHGATLILQSYSDDFSEAASLAISIGDSVLKPKISNVEHNNSTARSGQNYSRNPKIRAAVLQMAAGRCERCDQLGFLTVSGTCYLETHHIVGVAESGPDSIDNVIAVCPNCHRQAHFAANRVQVENEFMRAIRRRRKDPTPLNLEDQP